MSLLWTSYAAVLCVLARLAHRYRRSGGDLALLMRALLESPEFWQAAAQRSKHTTPSAGAADARIPHQQLSVQEFS